MFCAIRWILYTRQEEKQGIYEKEARSKPENLDEEMTLVDCYYIPTFRLLKLEVEKELAALFPKVTRI